ADQRFRALVRPFQQQVARFGLYNSLSQTLLKLTAPGVPDIYQGNELWDFSMVDPDNRRAIGYAHRAESLRALGPPSPQQTQALLASLDEGRTKLAVTRYALLARQQ